MAAPLAGWRLPLRLAWRDLMRYKGRSLLAALLILLPVAAMAAMLTFSTTMDVSDGEKRAGMYANARAYVQFPNDASQKVAAFPTAHRAVSVENPPTEQQVSAQIDAPVTAEITAQATFAPSGDGSTHFTAIDGQYFSTTLSSPLIGNTVTLASGRMPRAANEIVVTDRGRQLGLPDHGTITLAGFIANSTPVTVTIVGVAHTRLEYIAAAGAVLPRTTGPANEFAIGGSKPITQDVVDAWAKYGATFESSDIPPGPAAPMPPEELFAIITATMAFICVTALLAAPAFAAGATRHRRSLGLVASNGGTRKALRRMIFAQAMLLGALTALVASVAGAAAGVIAARRFGMRERGVTPPVDVRVTWLVALVVVATLASLLAAYVPARSAGKTNLLVALRGQVSSRVVKKRWPTLGVALVGAGLACLAGALALGSSSGAPLLTVVGMPLLFIGGILAVPYFLMVVGKFANRLPLTARLAVRDVSRQRTRATATIGAVLATVAVFTGISVFSSSYDRYLAKQYSPNRPVGTGVFDPSTIHGHPSDAQVARAVAQVKALAHTATPKWTQYDVANLRALGYPGQCTKSKNAPSTLNVMAVDSDGIAALDLDAVQRSALDGGGVLIVGAVPPGNPINFATDPTMPQLTPSAIKGGRLTLPLLDTGATNNSDGSVKIKSCHDMTVPAAGVPFTAAWKAINAYPSTVIMTTKTAHTRGIPMTFAGIEVAPKGGIGSTMESQLQAVSPLGMRLSVERGYSSPTQTILRILAAAFALVILLTTVVSTLLNDAESQADAATLATIGAPNGMRRLVVGAQAAVLGMVGAFVGIVIGTGPGLLLARSSTGKANDANGHVHSAPGTYVMPWTLIAVMLIGIPLVAALISMTFARRSPTLTRREH